MPYADVMADFVGEMSTFWLGSANSRSQRRSLFTFQGGSSPGATQLPYFLGKCHNSGSEWSIPVEINKIMYVVDLVKL